MKKAGSATLQKLKAIHCNAAILLLTKSVSAVAAELGVHEDTVSNWARSDLFRSYHQEILAKASDRGFDGVVAEAKVVISEATRKPRKPCGKRAAPVARQRDPSQRAKELIKGNKSRKRLSVDRFQRVIDEGVCQLTGIPFDMQSHGWQMPSLDRIVAGKEYTDDNTRVVLYGANVMMNKWGVEPILAVADGIRRKRSEDLLDVGYGTYGLV